MVNVKGDHTKLGKMNFFDKHTTQAQFHNGKIVVKLNCRSLISNFEYCCFNIMYNAHSRDVDHPLPATLGQPSLNCPHIDLVSGPILARSKVATS